MNERVILLSNDFNPFIEKYVVEKLREFDAEGDDDISLILNSPGGMVWSLYSILDAIDEIKSKVNIIVIGKAMSCGAILLAHGHKRYMTKNSMLMWHEASVVNAVDGIRTHNYIRRMNELMEEWLRNNSKLPNEKIEECLTKDTYFTAEQALKYGLVDAII